MRISSLIGFTLATIIGQADSSGAAVEGPHLFFSEADVPTLRARSESQPWIIEARRKFLSRADEFLRVPTEPYSLVSSENGPGTSGRAFQQRLGTLAFAGYLTGEEKYFQKARSLLLAVVRQYRANDRQAWPTHLQYADAAQGLAIGADWLNARLTAAERKEVRARVAEFGQLLYSDDSVWGRDNSSVMSCNHNAVQFGALGLCALVLGDRPEWLARATERVRDYFMHFVDQDGYATEGHSYLGYGLLGAIPFAHALSRNGGPDLMAEQPLLKATGEQVLWKLLPGSHHMLAMNDSEPIATNATVAYPMIKFGCATQLWAWWQSARAMRGPEADGVGNMTHGLSWPFLLLAGDLPAMPAAVPAGTPLGKRFASGRVFLRSRWNDPQAAHVSFTSGYDFHQGHNHQDENAVTLYALGEDFLTDPGYKPWESRHHTTLKLGRAEQVRGSIGKILEYREDDFGAFVHGQAQRAYDIGLEWIGHCDRRLYFVRTPHPYVVWCDDAQLESDGEVEYTTRFVTAPSNRFAVAKGGGIDIIGSRAGAKCRVRVFNLRGELAVIEDNLRSETFVERGQTYSTAKFLRRASATDRTEHLRLVTVAFPYTDEAMLPRISMHENEGGALVCELAFPKGGIDRVFFGSDGVARGERESP
ncbi:MAG: hypothetical protein JSR48_10690 [Verrucomicrobia bacterium]|nr:hypothetical protein [Verrucomicrobiota bacterium]